VWKEYSDADGKAYFYNTKSLKTQWERPAELCSTGDSIIPCAADDQGRRGAVDAKVQDGRADLEEGGGGGGGLVAELLKANRNDRTDRAYNPEQHPQPDGPSAPPLYAVPIPQPTTTSHLNSSGIPSAPPPSQLPASSAPPVPPPFPPSAPPVPPPYPSNNAPPAPPPFPSAPPYASTAKAIASASSNAPRSSIPIPPPFPASSAASRGCDADQDPPDVSGGGLLSELQGVRARLRPAKTKLAETSPGQMQGGMGKSSTNSMGNSRKIKSVEEAPAAEEGGSSGRAGRKSPRPQGQRGSLGAIFATAMMKLANVHGHRRSRNGEDGGFSSEDENEPALV
jgi:hypothetical protein